MTLKEFCSVYGGRQMSLYIPRDKLISVDSAKTYASALKEYGNYRVTYFDIYGYGGYGKKDDYSLNITIEK